MQRGSMQTDSEVEQGVEVGIALDLRGHPHPRRRRGLIGGAADVSQREESQRSHDAPSHALIGAVEGVLEHDGRRDALQPSARGSLIGRLGRLGLGAMLCALVVACGTSPKETSRTRTASPSTSSSTRADGASSSSKASSAPSTAAKRKAQRQAKRKAPTRSAAAGKGASTKSAKVPASPGPGAAAGTFLWPATGQVSGRFNGGSNKGIDIRGNPGDPVVAAAKGRVVYVGSTLRGYGNLVMVKHDKDLMTAYAHNRKILVRENQQVQAGQQIAEMGNTDSSVTRLHFEVRRGGHAVDPMPYLKAGPAAP